MDHERSRDSDRSGNATAVDADAVGTPPGNGTARCGFAAATIPRVAVRDPVAAADPTVGGIAPSAAVAPERAAAGAVGRDVLHPAVAFAQRHAVVAASLALAAETASCFVDPDFLVAAQRRAVVPSCFVLVAVVAELASCFAGLDFLVAAQQRAVVAGCSALAAVVAAPAGSSVVFVSVTSFAFATPVACAWLDLDPAAAGS